MAYYFDHQEEIDAEIRAEWEQAEQGKVQSPRSPFFVRMQARGYNWAICQRFGTNCFEFGT